jgi:arylsulfatase
LAGGTYHTTHEGHAVPPMEGVSLVPSLNGKKVTRSKPILMEHEGNKMLRDGDWKIVKEYEKKPTDWRLYDLRNDPTEMHDLAGQYPQKVSELEMKYNIIANHIGVEPSLEFTVGLWYTPVGKYFE